MSANLFTLLARGTQRNLENYCTSGLSWILTNDTAARSAFLGAFAAKLNGSARDVVRSLAEQDVLDIRPHRWIAFREGRQSRHACPDLWIADEQSRACMLVEIKVGAREGQRHPLDDADGDEAPCEPRSIPQTEIYRRWLNSERPGTGTLCAVVMAGQADIIAECDASLTWDELVAALRAQSVNEVTLQFCDFLEDNMVATKDFDLSEQEARSLANDAWEAVGLLLDEVTTRLSPALSSDDMLAKLREGWTTTYRDVGKQWIWTGYVVLSRGKSRLEVTPYLRIDEGPVQFLIGLVCANLTLERAQRLLPDSQIEDDEGEIYVLIDHDPWALGEPSTRRQADEMARVAADQIRPLVSDVLSQGE